MTGSEHLTSSKTNRAAINNPKEMRHTSIVAFYRNCLKKKSSLGRNAGKVACRVSNEYHSITSEAAMYSVEILRNDHHVSKRT